MPGVPVNEHTNGVDIDASTWNSNASTINRPSTWYRLLSGCVQLLLLGASVIYYERVSCFGRASLLIYSVVIRVRCSLCRRPRDHDV